MANDYYTRAELSAHTRARSAQVNTQLLGVEVGFDRLPGKLPLLENRVTYLVDAGVADAAVVTLSPAISAYVAGLRLTVKMIAINTGACTIDVNGVGVRSIKLTDGTNPAAGNIVAGITELVYDGTNFVIMSVIPGGVVNNYNPAAVDISGGTISGVTISDFAVADGLKTAPAIRGSDANSGIYFDNSGQDLHVVQNGVGTATFNQSGITIGNTNWFGWSNVDESDTQTTDVRLYREGGGILALKRTTIAQLFRIYNTDDGSGNLERGFCGWGSDIFQIGTQKAGTGTLRGINFGLSGNSIGFYGTTPVAQPSATGETTGFTAGTGTAANDDSTFTGNVGSTAYRISDVVKHLKNLGLIAA